MLPFLPLAEFEVYNWGIEAVAPDANWNVYCITASQRGLALLNQCQTERKAEAYGAQ